MDEQERSRLLVSHGDRASAEQTVHTITRRPLPAGDIATCIADNLLTSPEAWRWWLEGGSRENITDEVGRIACPVLVMVGSEDPVIPPHVIKTQVTPRFADAKCTEIAGAGHLLPLEAAQEVSEAIESFIGSLEIAR
jgi:pimeloyl-ACP methyl ester carboxylesterase